MKRYVKMVNILLLVAMFIGDIIYLVFGIMDKNINKILTCLALVVVIFIPIILKKLHILKLSKNTIVVYNIFIFFADFLGCVVGLYNKTTYYDIIMHFISGILTSIFGFAIYNYLSKNDNKHKALKITYIIGFSMMVAVLWEIFEFLGDNILHMNLQHNDVLGVKDTMEDMICAVLGTALFLIVYLNTKKASFLHKFVNKMELN